MFNHNDEQTGKQDNPYDPVNAAQAENRGQQYNRDGENESATTASAQRENLLSIPRELRERPQWCLAAEDKRPLQLDGANASSVVPATWSTFDAVYLKAKELGLGIGYVLTKDDPFTCIDLDVKESSSSEHIARVNKIVNEFGSFTEHSRSGRGYHVWLKGSVPQGRKRDGIEVYSSERFIVCTGNIVMDLPVEDRQTLLSTLYYEMSPDEEEIELPPDQPEIESDQKIVEQLFSSENKEHVESLWCADWERIGYTDHSKADIALLQIIAFYTPNNNQLRRLFLRSELGQRDKANRPDYLPRTIKKVRLNQSRDAREREAAILHGKHIVEVLLKNWMAKRSSRIKVFLPEELAKRPLMNWLVKGVLPDSGLVSIYGAPSAGKSFLVLDLLAHISANDYWFGRKTKERNVAYVAFEGMGGIPQRVKAFETQFKPLKNFKFVEAPTINLLEDSDRKDFIAVMKEHLLTNSVICLDTLAASAPGMDENSSEGMGKLIGEVTKIQQEVGGLIILVHHSGKDDKRGLRGWSGLLGALDCAIKVTKNTDGSCFWEVTKSKDGKNGIGSPFQLTTVELGHDEDGEPITSCVINSIESVELNRDSFSEVKTDEFILGWIEKELSNGNYPSGRSLESQRRDMGITLSQQQLRDSISRLKSRQKVVSVRNENGQYLEIKE